LCQKDFNFQLSDFAWYKFILSVDCNVAIGTSMFQMKHAGTDRVVLSLQKVVRQFMSQQ
jgi:hypothetical protein